MKKLFIIFAVLCLAAPAMAADWNFYGSARFATFYVDDDYDLNDVQYDDDSDLQWAQQGNSRIGANVKFNDEIGGGFEMSDSFGKRKLFGTYNFGEGSQLLIGQTYAPSAWFYSNSVYDGDGDLLGIGEFYEGRVPMIQLKMGGFKLALIEPTEDGINDPMVDVSMPKIEAGYSFKGDAFFVDVFGGYQTYTWDGGKGGKDLDFDSYVVGLGIGANFGAFYVKAGAHMGQNVGNYGAYMPAFLEDVGFVDEAVVVGDKVKDTDAFGFLAVLGYNLSDMITIEGGGGYTDFDKDVENSDKDKAYQLYLNSTVNIAPNFFIVPEVGYIHTEPDTKGAEQSYEPERFYIGAKWQINF